MTYWRQSAVITIAEPAIVIIPLATFQGNGAQYIEPTEPPTPNQGSIEIQRNREIYVSRAVSTLIGTVTIEHTDVAHMNGGMILQVFVCSADSILLGSASTNGDGIRTQTVIPITDPGTPPISTLFPGELIIRFESGSRNGDYLVHRVWADSTVLPLP